MFGGNYTTWGFLALCLMIVAALTAVIGPAMTRLSMRFASPEAYLDFWRVHRTRPGAERAAGARGAALRPT